MAEKPTLQYIDRHLHIEGVPFGTLAETYGTPLYVYSGDRIDAAFQAVSNAFASRPALIAYAVKANDNLSILRRLAQQGCGADIVSGGELARCLKAGIPPEKIVFSGVGKRDDELRLALESKIRSIHVESVPEVEVLGGLAEELGVEAPISLRINPDVDAETHPYIATGLHHTKFGLEMDAARALLPKLIGHRSLRLEGITCHIGSQLRNLAPLVEGVQTTAAFAVECRKAGAPMRTIDAGGGFPVHYGNENLPFPPAGAFADAIYQALREADAEDFELIVEPGRALVAEAGVLLTEVIFEKDQDGKRFVICDAAMTELIRPALYDAYHGMRAVDEPDPAATFSPADVVGPVCESGDFLAKDRDLPPLPRGSLLAIGGAGAYGSVMSSRYNARPRPAEVCVDGDTHTLIRRRQTLEDLWREEL